MEDTEEDILDGVLSDEETEPSSADSEPLTEEAAAIKIQSISRMHEEREAFLDKQHAATDIQKLARGNRSRRNSREEEKEEVDAAIKIQARIRQREAKQKVEQLRQERDGKDDTTTEEEEGQAQEQEQEQEQEQVPEADPEALENAEEERENSAAVLIQARIRQKEAKSRVDRLRAAKEVKEAEEENKAAIKIENRFRQKQAKKELQHRRDERQQETNAAIKIENRYRQKQAKKELDHRREERQQQRQQKKNKMNNPEEDQNWLDEEFNKAGVTGHGVTDVDKHYHRGVANQKHHKQHKKSKSEKFGLYNGQKLDEGGRDTYVASAYVGQGGGHGSSYAGNMAAGENDHTYRREQHTHVNRDGKEVDYIRHAKQKKQKKKTNSHKYDPEMFEKVFELIEGVVDSNRNSKDGFGARTIFGEHTSSIQEVFMALDRDKDGTVTHEEFKRGMHRLGVGLTDKQITVMLKHMDKDGSGDIEYNEFIKMFEEAHVEHKRVQKMLHHHKRDPSTASHKIKSHRTEEERRKKQHQDLVMKKAGMAGNKTRGGGDSSEFSNNKNQSLNNRAQQRHANFSNNNRQRNANGVSNDRPTNSPGWRDQSQSKIPKYGSSMMGTDPDLLFDDSDPFFRDALDTLSAVPKKASPSRRSTGGAASPIGMNEDNLAQITAKAPWVAFIVGGPGSSAHKICAEMARMHGYTHLSAEQALRNEVSSGSSTGKEIIHAISQGRVPVDSMIEVIMRNILKSSGTRVLVEGFPQDIEQAQGFEEAIGAVQGVVYVKCSRREMQRRILEAAGKDAGDIDSVATVRDARRQISEFEDKIAEVLTYYSLGNKIFVIKDGPSLLKMCNQTDSFLGRFPAPSRSFGTQTDSGLVAEDTASNLPQSLNDWSEMREKPSPFFNGENTAVDEGFIRGGRNGQSINIPTPPNQRSSRRGGNGNGKNNGGGPRTEKIQQNQQQVLDGPRSELEKWFQSINIMAGPVSQWRTNFANGYLMAQILELFFSSEIQSVGFHTGVSSSNKRDNWRQLQTFFLRYEFPLSDNEIMGMMQAKKSAIVPMLLKLHGFLCNQG